jgi:K(+)-stimulated pyrophosphate-energized sodium pump
MPTTIAAPIGAGILSLLVATYMIYQVMKADEGTETMRNIGKAIQEGSMAFLRREYTYLAAFVVLVAIVVGILIDPQTAGAYVIGALISAFTGFLGMMVATRANTRTAAAAERGLNPALRIAFSSGAVMGLSVVGLGLIGVGLTFWGYAEGYGNTDIKQIVQWVTGFSFGASSIALFARVGGGIYTKAADVGADLVGKVEQGIPEDDPRNPATIADNVGDNVGDVAGMGADLFESYVGSIIAAMALAVFSAGIVVETYDSTFMVLPMMIAGAGIICSIIGTNFVRAGDNASFSSLLWAIRRGIFAAAILVLLASYLILNVILDIPATENNANPAMDLFWAIVAGLGAGVIIGLATEYYTSYEYGPTKHVSSQGETGPATVIAGFALGMKSTVIPVFVVAGATWISFELFGFYGVAIAAVGMLSTLGITLATDAYGPVADNAGGIAEQAGLDPEVRERTDALDSLGNTTAATGKGFAIGSAALTALALMAAYANATNLGDAGVNLLNARVLVGLFIGGMLPFLFSSMTMAAVGRAAAAMVTEVRRQFQEIPGIMDGTGQPDYARCVDISTKGALREMILPGVLAVAAPLAVGYTMGATALGGMLIGSIAGGFMLAVTMANAGGAWDNAKKYIEAGHGGGKGSSAHEATVVGDTVGDPFKDTSGPSLNILLKLMSIVALVFADQFSLAGLL